jgi:hypothetical protein
MATQNTAVYDIQNGTPSVIPGANTNTQSRVPSVHHGGEDYVVNTQHTTTSAVTAGSQQINLFKLPRGAKVNSLEVIVPASVGTSSAKIGFSGDDDRYGSGKSLASAGRVQFITVAADADYITTQEENVFLSPVTTNFATAITFQVVCKYTVV